MTFSSNLPTLIYLLYYFCFVSIHPQIFHYSRFPSHYLLFTPAINIKSPPLPHTIASKANLPITMTIMCFSYCLTGPEAVLKEDFCLHSRCPSCLLATVLKHCRGHHNNISLHFNGHFPGEPELAGFTGAKDDGGGGDNWSHKTCKAPVKSLPPAKQYPTFYRPDALPVTQPKVSTH